MITADTLRELGACDYAVRMFERLAPKGMPSWKQIADHPLCRPDWKGWIAAHAPDLSEADRDRLAQESDDPHHWFQVMAARLGANDKKQHAHWIARSLAAKSRSNARTNRINRNFANRALYAWKKDSPASMYGVMAAFQTNLRPLERERLIKISDSPRHWFAVAAVHAPRVPPRLREAWAYSSIDPPRCLREMALDVVGATTELRARWAEACDDPPLCYRMLAEKFAATQPSMARRWASLAGVAPRTPTPRTRQELQTLDHGREAST